LCKHITRVDLTANVDIDKVGNKVYNLHRLLKGGYVRVPLSVSLNIHETGNQSVAIDELLVEIHDRFIYPLIARSSSSVEDSDSSFAGLFFSTVCQNDNELIEGIHKIVSSANSENVKLYCKYRGIDVNAIRMAVLIQQYLCPQLAGVLFTKHPVIQTDDMYIEYKSNSSDAVTSGETNVSSKMLSRNSAIDDTLFAQLRDIAVKAENNFGYPLDIEWIISDDKLWIVQVRKITGLIGGLFYGK
jgi:pyruvate,water dikinase